MAKLLNHAYIELGGGGKASGSGGGRATSGHPLRYAYHKVTYTSILPGLAPTSLAQGLPSTGRV